MEPYFPSNRNVTVQIEAGSNVTPQVYVRDLAIAAVVCFTCGVGLTLMAFLIHYRVSRRREEKTARREREKEEEEVGERPEEQEYSAWERQKELTSPGDGRKPWDGQADILAGNSGGHFRCPHCRGAGLGGRGRRVGGMEDETLAEVENKRRRREQEGEERRSGIQPHKGVLNPHMVANGGPGYPHPSARPPQGILRPYKAGQEPGHYRTDGSGREPDHYRTDGSGREPDHYRTDGSRRELGHYRTDGSGREPDHYRTDGSGREPDHYRTDGSGREPDHYKTVKSGREPGSYSTDGSGREPDHYRTDRSGREPDHYRTGGDPKARAAFETQNCDDCHQTYRTEYRPEDLTGGQERFSMNPADPRPSTRGREAEGEGGDHSSNDRRGRRNVTFYLERPLDPRKEGSRRSGEKERRTREKRGEGGKREGRHKTRAQSSRLLRVKLNLSPVRRNKVHPRKSSERRHSEERSSRREGRGGEGRKENRLDGKGDKGGGRKEKSNETMKSKATKSKKSAEEDDGAKKQREEGHNKKTSSEERPSQQSSEPDHHVSVETTDQSEPSRAPEGLTHTNGQRLNLQPAPPPFPPSVPASVSLLGIPSAARPGPSLSLRANPPQTPSCTTFNSHINGSLGANVAYLGLHGLNQNMAAPADAQSLALQRGLRPSASAASLLASAGRGHPALGRALSTPSVYATQSGELASGLALNPAVNPAHIIQSLSRPQPPPENLPVVPGPTADPPQGPGLRAGQEPHVLAPGAGLIGAGPSGDAGGGDGGVSQAHVPVGGGPVVVAIQSAGVAPPGGVATTGTMCSGQAEGGMTLAPAEGVSRVVSPGGVVSSPGGVVSSPGGVVSSPGGVVSSPGGVVSSPGGMATAGSQALLQQEYLLEDGSSSPRRKLKLVLPEKASSRPPTALERKIR